MFTNKLEDEAVTDGQTLTLLVGSIQEVERFLVKQNVTVRYVLFNPSAWSDGHCPHAARSHSFVYISTS